MNDTCDGFDDLVERLRVFVAERDWSQFHDPKNLAMALASEAGELVAELRWVSNADADAYVRDSAHREQIEQEVADVAIALLLFCDRGGIDLRLAIRRKIDLNAANYPVLTARGIARRPPIT
jgi:dCTP diphosphatase